MEKITYDLKGVAIEKIYRNNTDREGKPFVSLKGNAYTKIDIYINADLVNDADFEGKMTYFDYFNNAKDWDVGTLLTGSVEKNGKYFNFQLPDKRESKGGTSQKDIDEIKAKLDKILSLLQSDTQEEEEVADLPF